MTRLFLFLSAALISYTQLSYSSNDNEKIDNKITILKREETIINDTIQLNKKMIESLESLLKSDFPEHTKCVFNETIKKITYENELGENNLLKLVNENRNTANNAADNLVVFGTHLQKERTQGKLSKNRENVESRDGRKEQKNTTNSWEISFDVEKLKGTTPTVSSLTKGKEFIDLKLDKNEINMKKEKEMKHEENKEDIIFTQETRKVSPVKRGLGKKTPKTIKKIDPKVTERRYESEEEYKKRKETLSESDIQKDLEKRIIFLDKEIYTYFPESYSKKQIDNIKEIALNKYIVGDTPKTILKLIMESKKVGHDETLIKKQINGYKDYIKERANKIIENTIELLNDKIERNQNDMTLHSERAQLFIKLNQQDDSRISNVVKDFENALTKFKLSNTNNKELQTYGDILLTLKSLSTM